MLLQRCVLLGVATFLAVKAKRSPLHSLDASGKTPRLGHSSFLESEEEAVDEDASLSSTPAGRAAGSVSRDPGSPIPEPLVAAEAAEYIDESAVNFEELGADEEGDPVKPEESDGATHISWPQGPVLASNQSVTVEITWVRHGLSCANINKRFNKPPENVSGWKVLRAARGAYNYLDGQTKNMFSMTDPILSDCGRKRSERLAARLANMKFDLVGASGLLRAQETAALQFGGRKVHVLPFISEWPSICACNSRKSTKEQKAIMNPLGYKIDYKFWTMAERMYKQWKVYDYVTNGPAGLDVSFVEQPRFPRFQKPCWADMSQALKYIGSAVVPSLLTKTKGATSTVRLGMVSHSQFMKGNLECDHVWAAVPKRKDPWNNEAVTVTYTYDGITLTPVPGSCELTALAEAPLASICPQEFARCPTEIMNGVNTGECGCDDSERQLALRSGVA